MSDLVGNPEEGFSRVAAHIIYHPDTEYYKVLLFQIFGLLHIVLSPLNLAANDLCGLINTKTNAKIYLLCRLKSCCV